MVQFNFIKPIFSKCFAVYDTGAQHTCFTALSINSKLTVEDFKDSEKLTVGGILAGSENGIEYYKMYVKDFYFGNILITGVDVWVTFDDRVTDNVIGMDVLYRLNRLSVAYSNKELFFKDTQEMIDYINKNLTVQSNTGSISNGKNTNNKILTMSDIYANFVNTQINNEKDKKDTPK